MRIDAGAAAAGAGELGAAFPTAMPWAATESRMATRAEAASGVGTCARSCRIAGAGSAANLATAVRTFVPVKAGVAKTAVVA
jgi:hypothetical protein